MNKNFRIYRPNKAGSGNASSLEIRKDDKAEYETWLVFWQFANQTGMKDGNASFDWKNGITMKLGETDIGELMAVLENRKQAAGTGKGLYHQTDKGSKVLYFESGNTDDGTKYKARISTSKENAITQYLSSGEATVFLELLKEAVRAIYGVRN